MALPKTTTFIPKRPMVGGSKPPRTIGLLNVLSTVLLVLSVLAAGGAFIYEQIIQRNIQEKQVSIGRIRENFVPETLEGIQDVDVKMRSAKELLEKHVVVSPIFLLLESTTLKNLRYTNLEYSIREGIISLILNGYAESYRTIANQSAVLAQHTDYISDYSFSNFNLTIGDEVSFQLSMTINADQSLYADHLDVFGSGGNPFSDPLFDGGDSFLDNEEAAEIPILDPREQDVVNIFNNSSDQGDSSTNDRDEDVTNIFNNLP